MSVYVDPLAQLRTLALKVQAMRDKQREYFDPRRRTAATLREAKELEAAVDDMVEAVLVAAILAAVSGPLVEPDPHDGG